ncbi:hypothetical protein HOLleu_24332 [Holothuria leucospilota]|uniref:Uncharacterized protein n=1 Tax=Holothuria leucospilota TaxID=206669 RepID=A0A9Q1H5U6_HOLLE|nr:hypothetical protein HOLleu_24332 [Holothuria leucospilota]
MRCPKFEFMLAKQRQTRQNSDRLVKTTFACLENLKSESIVILAARSLIDLSLAYRIDLFVRKAHHIARYISVPPLGEFNPIDS